MKQWLTQIKAIDPSSGNLKTYAGPNVPGINIKDAENYCHENGLGYCIVIGELISEIPCKQNSLEPDFSKKVDHENVSLN